MAVSASVRSMTMEPPERSQTRRSKALVTFSSIPCRSKRGSLSEYRNEFDFEPRHEMAHEIDDAPVILGRIDDDLLGIGGEEIADRPRDQIEILMDQRRGRRGFGFLLNASP